PLAMTTSPAESPVLTRTPPLTPTAPGWMCAMLIGVFAGNPASCATKVAVAAVIVVPLVVVSNVIVTLPLPDDSAFVIGGFSLAGDSTAVNVGRTVLGEVDDEPHPAT